MKRHHLAAAGGLALTAVLAGSTGTAMAKPPDGSEGPRCPGGYVWNGEECVRRTPPPPPPPPKVVPELSIDTARQTTDRAGIHVGGWTAEADAPLTPLPVTISVDGGPARRTMADTSRPDVAAAYPRYGAAHGYDIVVSAADAPHKVCVTALHVGANGVDRTACAQMDRIVRFDAQAIDYDTAHVVITDTRLDQLHQESQVNATTIQQSTTISGQKQVTETQGWSDTAGIKVTVSAGFHVGIPLIEGTVDVSVEGSYSFTQNGSTATSTTYSWTQPIIVPPRSRVVGTVAVTQSTLTVPYTMSGTYVYNSGAGATGSINGTYYGTNSHDLQVQLAQFNLDGTPAAHPVPQPAAALHTSSPSAR